jgi:hypothetical protein
VVGLNEIEDVIDFRKKRFEDLLIVVLNISVDRGG